ncbi:dTMP kinase [Anaeromyxobacter oryzae]|uniref:Thymidylate kinase n=1 Tax=Anaeromyxobacter oryzae TaxID=2918170 RepID=A0ABM7X454_9BACT|nr:dTMP kinase [Anaeromyxobacter oryzae]BDG06595.1 dTMP kinase [Anaeromyxobacter oryzae]
MTRRGRGASGAKDRQGRLLVVEGLDGAGTTTQARLLGERLRAAGRTAHVTAEPSGGPAGALIRQVLSRRVTGRDGRAFDARALALLFAADRLDHHADEIAPKLSRGVDVVSDRFTLSSLAYQGAALGDMAWVAEINRAAPSPDLTVFLRVSPRVALPRRRAATLDREIFEVDAFQRRVAASYERALEVRRAAGDRIAEIDGSRPVEAVADAVWAAVSSLD